MRNKETAISESIVVVNVFGLESSVPLIDDRREYCRKLTDIAPQFTIEWLNGDSSRVLHKHPSAGALCRDLSRPHIKGMPPSVRERVCGCSHTAAVGTFAALSLDTLR